MRAWILYALPPLCGNVINQLSRFWGVEMKAQTIPMEGSTS